ncbi:CBD9-like protein [Venustampulla echinocandica]|uniref:CBD9-like protein n=1 Tax=Venustampulla echinocandica TaxID=2656787 RepID=A0A370U3I5_9HELO|nr:CBD9-like protein [Venustampulla echinocandica]RDL42332.1 CBD9-like protein [Venustampulla echinocandica]
MKRWLQAYGLVLASLAPLTAAIANYTPLSSSTSPKYSVGIPPGSTISQSTKGGIYISITAPTSYQWVGLGIGRQMAGSTMFVVYADGAGNVTVSGRNGGQGHNEPALDTSLMTGVTVLAGSGVANGVMTAFVHCTTCTLASTASSTSSPWIAAWNEGSSINSKSLSYSISQHGGNAFRQFSFDLTKSTLSSDSNPFVASSPSPPSKVSSSGASLNPTANPSPNPTSSSSSDPDSDDPDSQSSSNDFTPDFKTIEQYLKAHGIIMGVTVVLLFPLGSIFMRTVRHPWIHAAIQIFSLCAMIVGLALGVKLAQFTSMLFNNSHSIFGVVVVALFMIQPVLGLIHHHLYTKTQSRSIFSHLHVWYGRILMILAVLNGGFGLRLAANSKKGEIAYGVVAGFIALLYASVVLLKRRGGEGGGRRRLGVFGKRDKDAGQRDASS